MASINVIQGIYAKDYGLSLKAISAALLVAGMFDAITDPVIGYLSDRERLRTGTRRVFVIGGALAFPVCAFFFFIPVFEPTLTYFLFWYLAFYLALTFFTIPHLAWGGEIETEASKRNAIFGFRAFTGYVGFLIFAIIPLLSLTDTSEITPETLRITVVVTCLLLIPALVFFVRTVPNGQYTISIRKPEHPLRAFASLRKNPLFVLFLCGFALFGLAGGVGWSLIFVVLSSYLELGESYAYLYLLHLIVSCASITFGLKIMKRLDKKASYVFAMAVAIVAYLLWPLALMGGSLSIFYVAGFMVLMGPVSALTNIVSFSLLADIIDYERLRSHVDRSAICYGLVNLGAKTTHTLGMSAAFWIASLFHFDPTAAQQSSEAYWGLAIAMGFLPVCLCTLAMAVIGRISMTSGKHDIIRRRLMQREARAHSKS